MVRAYDIACADLKIDGSDPRSGELATVIIQLGETETQPFKLAELALVQLWKAKKT
jgi:hypothetical protein